MNGVQLPAQATAGETGLLMTKLQETDVRASACSSDLTRCALAALRPWQGLTQMRLAAAGFILLLSAWYAGQRLDGVILLQGLTQNIEFR